MILIGDYAGQRRLQCIVCELQSERTGRCNPAYCPRGSLLVEVHRAISHQFNMIVASHSLLREQYATDCCTRRTAVDLVTGRLPAQSQTRPDATTAWRPSSVLYQVRAYCSTANNPRGTSRSMRVLCCLSQDDLFRVPSPLQYYPTQRALSRRISFTHLSSAW